MKLNAVCSIRVTALSDCPMIAMLRPRSGQAQQMVSERYDLQPRVPVNEFADSYGNLPPKPQNPKAQLQRYK